jgi:L-lactate dehydrogenase complex protein LldG
MSAREEILDRLRQLKYASTIAEGWPYQIPDRDLVAQFSQALKAAKGEVFTVKNLAEAWGVLGKVLADIGARNVVFNQDPPLNGENLENGFPQFQWEAAGGTERELRRLCQEADVGVTGAEFALAQTGSIGISSGAHHSRMVSLLPPVHIVLFAEKVLIPDPISWESIRPKSMPSQIVFISGPSKTADIEQTLVVGAHGPKRLIAIIYGEA